MSDLKNSLLVVYENLLEKEPVPNPADINSEIVEDVLLPEIGFSEKKDRLRNKGIVNSDGRVNIVIQQAERKVFYVESYSAKDISSHAINESVTTMRSMGIKYGVLTNGLIYTLVSSEISSLNGKPLVGDYNIIFKFCLTDNKSKVFTKHNLLKYLHSDYILKSHIIDNFEYVAKYKVFRSGENKGNWHVYQSTLLNFFEYLSLTKMKRVSLNEITTDDFIAFIRWQTANSKNKNTETTLFNKYSHISALLTSFNNNELSDNHRFEKSRKDVIAEFNAATYESDREFLNSTDVKRIIDFFKSSDRDNRERNIAIFGMCTYFGAERRTITNLKWDAIGIKSKTIFLYGHTFDLPPLLRKCFEKIKADRKERNITSEYVFTRLYRKHYDRFSDTYINQLFDTIEKISDESKWQKYKPQMIRNSVVYKLYEEGAYLDEIMYFADISSKNIHNYISDAEISARRTQDIFHEREPFVHPFKSIFDASL